MFQRKKRKFREQKWDGFSTKYGHQRKNGSTISNLIRGSSKINLKKKEISWDIEFFGNE